MSGVMAFPGGIRRHSGRLWVVGLLAASSFLVPSPAQAETAVALSGNSFDPAEVTVPAGETVVWTNNDTARHTVTADDGSFDSHPSCGDLGGACMLRGETFKFTFKQPGTYPYHCRVHGSSGGGGMAGTVTVT